MVARAWDLERLAELCQRYGIVRLEAFGSAARGTADVGSDIDVLYTLGPGVRLGWAIEDFAAELAEILGRPVDLVSRRSLHPIIRDQVLAEAQPIYAAA